jgi:hypothetical protein
MMPALARGLQNVYVDMNEQHWPAIDIMNPVYLCQFLIIAMILLAAWKFGKLRHSATWLAVGVNIVNLFLEPLGRSEWIQQFLKSVVQG